MIEVTILNGEFSVNLDFFKNQDPYVKLEVDSQQYRTQVKHNAGRCASWRDDHFMVSGFTLKLKVFDHDILQDDMIGESDLVDL